MPNQENIRKWVDALRSGKYRQGKGQLKTDSGAFCCLGVACDISGLGGFDLDGYFKDDNENEDSNKVVLTDAVTRWLGFDDEGADPYVTNAGGVAHPLSSWNDDFDTSFEDIADMIEAKYLAPAPVA